MQAMQSGREAATLSLRRVLLFNGGLSVGSGALLAMAAQPLTAAMVPGVTALGGLPLWTIVTAVGIGVMLFGLELLYLATRERLLVAAGRVVFFADVAWVVGSAALLLLAGRSLSALAVETIAVFAGIVAVFAWVEFRAVRGMRSHSGTGPGVARGAAQS